MAVLGLGFIFLQKFKEPMGGFTNTPLIDPWSGTCLARLFKQLFRTGCFCGDSFSPFMFFYTNFLQLHSEMSWFFFGKMRKCFIDFRFFVKFYQHEFIFVKFLFGLLLSLQIQVRRFLWGSNVPSPSNWPVRGSSRTPKRPIGGGIYCGGANPPSNWPPS